MVYKGKFLLKWMIAGCLGNHHIVIILHKKSTFEVVFVVGES